MRCLSDELLRAATKNVRKLRNITVKKKIKKTGYSQPALG
jgi:hypothetical protein